MKFTIKSIVKKITNLPDEMRFNKLKERSTSSDFTEFHELAECYHKGIGTRRNYKQAIKWYIKEAETGGADVKYALGLRYWKGEKLVGGEKNEDEALRWIEIAADLGYEKAIVFLDENDSKDPAKLQAKIDNFKFGNLNETIRLAKKIQEEDKREEFVRKAIQFYETNVGIQNIIPLLDFVSDQDYKIYILLKHKACLSSQKLLDKFESEASDKRLFKLSLAKAYEKLGDIVNASTNFRASLNLKEISGFFCRQAKKLKEEGKLLEAYDNILESFNYDKDTASELYQQIMSAIKKQYSKDALELIDQINDATEIEELNDLKEKAEESHLDDIYNKKMKSIILYEMDNAGTLEELAESEDSVKVFGLEKVYYDRQREIIKDDIESCFDYDELSKLEDTATEYDLEDIYNKKHEEFGGNIEEHIENADDLDKLVEIENVAYERNCQDPFLERLELLIGEYDDISYTSYYTKFHEYETKEFMIEKIAGYMEDDYIDASSSLTMSYYENEMPPELWQDLPEQTRAQSKCAECYIAINEEDLEAALNAYSSPDFEDIEGWSGDGVESELESLYDNVKDRPDISLVDLYESYGTEDEETFLGVDLGDAYYEEGQQSEDFDDIEEAVRCYKVAAEKYNNASAKAKLEELYE